MVAKPSPLYSTLSLALIDFIKTKGKAHEKMLSEREITKVYNVSRTTVRTALKELETLGYIYKRHGKGTIHFNAMERTPKLDWKATVSRNR